MAKPVAPLVQLIASDCRLNANREEYSINRDGNLVVYATRVPPAGEDHGPTAEEIASGYRIPFQTPANRVKSREKLFITRRIQGRWSSAEPITITSPLSKDPLPALDYGNVPDLNPTLSPDGRSLLISYFDFSERMPDEWRESGYMQQYRNTSGVLQAFHLLVLSDTHSRVIQEFATNRFSAPSGSFKFTERPKQIPTVKGSWAASGAIALTF